MEYANGPSYSHEPSGDTTVTLAATGMDTLQSGPVAVGTVTVNADAVGTARLSLSMRALGDERGRSYVVGDSQGRTLSVQPASTPTDEPTPTEQSRDDDRDDDDRDDDQDGTPTPTPTTEPSTATPTSGTDQATPVPSPTANGAAPDPTSGESSSGSSLPTIVLFGLVVVVLVAVVASLTDL